MGIPEHHPCGSRAAGHVAGSARFILGGPCRAISRRRGRSTRVFARPRQPCEPEIRVCLGRLAGGTGPGYGTSLRRCFCKPGCDGRKTRSGGIVTFAAMFTPGGKALRRLTPARPNGDGPGVQRSAPEARTGRGGSRLYTGIWISKRHSSERSVRPSSG